MRRRLCLVTGASAGIGAALAARYAAEGWDLVLTARRADRLEALAAELRAAHGAACAVIAEDLSDPAAPIRLITQIDALGRPLDGLVNNAGQGGTDSVLRTDWSRHADFIQLMTVAPTQLAWLVLPGMAARGYGRVLNVCSIAGMLPPARGQSLYGAAKAYLIEASRALHIEARGTGAHVTALCPGLTRTEFHAAAGLDAMAAATPRFLWQSADAVARAGFRACEANAVLHVPGTANRAAVALGRALPQRAGMALMARASRGWERTQA